MSRFLYRDLIVTLFSFWSVTAIRVPWFHVCFLVWVGWYTLQFFQEIQSLKLVAPWTRWNQSRRYAVKMRSFKSIYHCSIAILTCSWFQLSLSNCQLQSIDSLKSCTELKELRLAHNEIKVYFLLIFFFTWIQSPGAQLLENSTVLSLIYPFSMSLLAIRSSPFCLWR